MGEGDLYELFVDTGAFIALIDENDPLHQASQTFYSSLKKRTKLLTTLLVVSETYTWLRYHAGHDSAVRFLDVIDRSERAGALSVICPNENMKNRVHTILQKYQDQDLSYTDATSFIILEDMKIMDVFGFDSHFYILKCNLWPIAKNPNPVTRSS